MGSETRLSIAAIPKPALILGWAGVLPFAALTGAAISGFRLPVDAQLALVGYGAVILSFMGGVQWGIALRSPAETRWIGYAVSVVPALIAWPCLLLPRPWALAGLIAGFLLLLAYDIWTVRKGWAPDWYAALRLELTVAVVTLLTASLAFG
jgi:hypothetical protein